MSPPGRRHRLTAALAVLSLLCGWLGLRPERSGAAVATVPRPLWSPDRLPALLAEAQGTVDLERAVDELLARSLAAPAAAVGGTPPVPRAVAAPAAAVGGTPPVPRAGARSCLAVYEGTRPVLLRRPDEALTPASTQKVLVATAALSVLGPDFRFETKVVAESGPRDGPRRATVARPAKMRPDAGAAGWPVNAIGPLPTANNAAATRPDALAIAADSDRLFPSQTLQPLTSIPHLRPSRPSHLPPSIPLAPSPSPA